MSNIRFIFANIRNFFYVLFYAIPKARKMVKNPCCSTQDRFDFSKRIMNRLRRGSRSVTEVYGVKNLPKEGGYVLYANHQGRYDALGVLLSLEKPVSVLWKKSQAERLLAREVCALLDAKKIDFEKPLATAKMMREMAKEIEAGKPYLIFPEGYYSDNKNELQPFKDGCFTCTLRSQTPVVPVALYDSWRAFNAKTLKKQTTQVHFLEPIPFAEVENMKTTEIASLVKERIQERLTAIANGTFCEPKSFTIQ